MNLLSLSSEFFMGEFSFIVKLLNEELKKKLINEDIVFDFWKFFNSFIFFLIYILNFENLYQTILLQML